MSRLSRWSQAAFAIFSAASLLAAPSDAAGQAEQDPDGAVEVSYGESTEIRPGEGWLIDCGTVGALEGIALACTPEGVTLASEGFDPDWGQQALPVTLVSGETTISVSYRVRLEAPPVPEVTTTRFDLPIAVGAQAMIPVSAFDITCAECSVDGGATLSLGALPPGVSAGVSETHLTVRAATPGDVVIPLDVTDDAGQVTPVELTVSFVAATSRDVAAVHVVSSADRWNLGELAWGTQLTAVCTPQQSLGIECASDGAARRTAKTGQLMFRVVNPDGQQAWGSVTFDASAKQELLAVPSWADEAPLSLVSKPEKAGDATDAAPLLDLALLLEGIPRT